jgi:4-hydroxy-tetrahydrodipicolinate reductase
MEDNHQIRVLVNGANGKMGQETVKAIDEHPHLILVGTADRNDNLTQKIQSSQANVVVDFTLASTVFSNAKTIIESGARPVIGTTGLFPDQINTLKALCETQKIGGIIAPNFSIAVVLMMQFAATAAQHFPNVEIIEAHHPNKEDAPSGTAIKTADIISQARRTLPTIQKSDEKIKGARGGSFQAVPIHSVRLPGIVADQEIIFGNIGETLRLRHTTLDRASFMPGVCLACEKVMTLNSLVYGLEHIL